MPHHPRLYLPQNISVIHVEYIVQYLRSKPLVTSDLKTALFLSKMGSKDRFYSLLQKVFHLATIVNAVPFKYSHAEQRFSVHTKSFKFLFWFAIVLLGSIVEMGQMFAELLRQLLDTTVERSAWCEIFMLFLTWSFIPICHLITLTKHHAIVDHLNQTIITRKWLLRYEGVNGNEARALVMAHLWIGGLQLVSEAALVSTEGSNPTYIYSNIPLKDRSELTDVAWVIYTCWRSLNSTLTGHFMYFVCILHGQTCRQILQLR